MHIHHTHVNIYTLPHPILGVEGGVRGSLHFTWLLQAQAHFFLCFRIIPAGSNVCTIKPVAMLRVRACVRACVRSVRECVGVFAGLH